MNHPESQFGSLNKPQVGSCSARCYLIMKHFFAPPDEGSFRSYLSAAVLDYCNDPTDQNLGDIMIGIFWLRSTITETVEQDRLLRHAKWVIQGSISACDDQGIWDIAFNIMERRLSACELCITSGRPIFPKYVD